MHNEYRTGEYPYPKPQACLSLALPKTIDTAFSFLFIVFFFSAFSSSFFQVSLYNEAPAFSGVPYSLMDSANPVLPVEKQNVYYHTEELAVYQKELVPARQAYSVPSNVMCSIKNSLVYTYRLIDLVAKEMVERFKLRYYSNPPSAPPPLPIPDPPWVLISPATYQPPCVPITEKKPVFVDLTAPEGVVRYSLNTLEDVLLDVIHFCEKNCDPSDSSGVLSMQWSDGAFHCPCLLGHILANVGLYSRFFGYEKSQLEKDVEAILVWKRRQSCCSVFETQDAISVIGEVSSVITGFQWGLTHHDGSRDLEFAIEHFIGQLHLLYDALKSY